MGAISERLQTGAMVTPAAAEPPRYLPRVEREQFGRSLRDRAKRVDQAQWVTGDHDMLGRLKASEVGRRTEYLAVRHGKMAASPFGFLRGAAWIMAPDLAATPNTGYRVQICGDAHIRNLGAFASPEGRIVFDVNDFDETCYAPWEFDLKRLAISIVVAGRDAGTSDKVARDAVIAMVRMWRDTLHLLADMPAMDLARYCVHRFEPDGPVGRVLRKSERMSPHAARDELTVTGHDGEPKFAAMPPKLVPVDAAERDKIFASLGDYRDTLGPNRQQVLDCYKPIDVAFKIAGTGSVGARNYAVLCVGNGIDDPLILQIKQALPSCYQAQQVVAHDARVSAHEGKRVAEGQHRMQTWTDPFLGWTTIDGDPCYVRQLSDHKAAIDPADLKRSSLVEYARVCGETFAKAFARTADAAVMSGYAGRGDKLDRAYAKLAFAGADQVTRDWEDLCSAIKRGAVDAIDID